ncbi:MAG: hypothetical protein J6S04_03115 [Clostridia bacterium]|nr:hypothetical protein [Clostridia bacterium]
MLKAKKKLAPILSFIFILAAVCLMGLSFSGVKAHAEAEETRKVELAEFDFFNAYSEDSNNVTIGQGKFGMLLRFSDVLSDNLSEINGGLKSVNLVEQYGEFILINDMPLTFYTDAEVCYYYEDYIWVYIPNMAIYRKLSVDTEFQFEDRIIQPFALYTAIDPNVGVAYWTNSAEAYLETKVQEVAFKKIEFNNTGYKYFSPKKGLLLEFDQKDENGNWLGMDLSDTLTERDGSWMEMNILHHSSTKNALLGEGASVGENIFLDGIPLKDIPGAELSYHSQRYLWIYAPDMIDYAKLEINDHTLFFDSYLPSVELYSNGNEWVDFDPNASRKDTTGTDAVYYSKIEWNNTDFDYRGNKDGLLLKFSKNLSKNAKDIDGSVREVNKVSTEIGKHILLDGVPLQNIAGTEISYHSEQFMWIYIPSEYLSLANGTFPCLTIEADTEFLNAILPEVSFYFDGSYWQEEEPSWTAYENNALVELMYNNVAHDTYKGYAYTAFVFEDDFEADKDSRPNFAQVGDAGLTVKINGKTLHELYQEDSNTCLFLNDSCGENALYLLVRKSDLYPTAEYPITTLTIEDGSKVMGKRLSETKLYLVDGVWSETSAPSTPTETDTVAPYIYYYGEDSYLVMTGDAVMDFSSMALAFDEVEGDVACTVEIPDGATSEGKWTRGEWQVKLLATDTQGNESEKIITVTAIDEEEEFLSIYVNGFFSYRVRYGDKIDMAKSEELLRGNPVKADTATSYFVFEGWTFNGKLWDFDNDIVTKDVWLSPSYREYKLLFTVAIKDVETGNSEFLTVKCGDEVDFSAYEKEGYTLLAKVDGTVVKSVTVNGNMSVELHYVPNGENGDNSKTAIILMAVCWVGGAALITTGAIFYKKFTKKKEGRK